MPFLCGSIVVDMCEAIEADGCGVRPLDSGVKRNPCWHSRRQHDTLRLTIGHRWF